MRRRHGPQAACSPRDRGEYASALALRPAGASAISPERGIGKPGFFGVYSERHIGGKGGSVTRKDYRLIADAIAEADDEAATFEQMGGVALVREKLVAALAADNPNFSAPLFRARATADLS